MYFEDDKPIIKHLLIAAKNSASYGLNLSVKNKKNKSHDIHELRVITKKLRAYWLLVYPLLNNNEDFYSHKQSLRNAAKSLNFSREEFVNRKLIQSFFKTCRHKSHKRILNQLLVTMSNVNPPEKRDDGIDLVRIFESEQQLWRELNLTNLNIQQETGITSTLKKVKKLGKKSLQHNLDPELSHQWRKWVKYAYYQLDVIPEKDRSKKLGRFIFNLEMLGKKLGKYHDLIILHQTISDRQADEAFLCKIEFVLKIINKKTEKLSRSIHDISNQLYESKYFLPTVI